MRREELYLTDIIEAADAILAPPIKFEYLCVSVSSSVLIVDLTFFTSHLSSLWQREVGRDLSNRPVGQSSTGLPVGE